MVEEREQLVPIAEVAGDLGLSVSRIRQLADAGVFPSYRTDGGHRRFRLSEVREAMGKRWLPTLPEKHRDLGDPDWEERVELRGLHEDRVWSKVASALEFDFSRPADHSIEYAFNEMLNNAIDHSGAKQATVRVWRRADTFAFEIVDAGCGAFKRLKSGLRLPDEFSSVLALTKGRQTTDPDNHTGEGIFFSSKVLDVFEIDAGGIAWIVDNIRNDTALGHSEVETGTRVYGQIDARSDRETGDVFRQFTEEERGFVRTRPSVRLLDVGVRFVSRSEARRFLDGLDEFDEIEIDFTGVDRVGQGFVDELLRVWPNKNPGKRIVPVNMKNEAVKFMVDRGLKR